MRTTIIIAIKARMCTSAPRSDTEGFRELPGSLSFPVLFLVFTPSFSIFNDSPFASLLLANGTRAAFPAYYIPPWQQILRGRGRMHCLQESIDASGHVKYPREQRPTSDEGKIIYRKGKRIVEP